jgi:hypothetical protein
MPGESKQNMERQLRDYAATRRRQAGGPFAVPPATRRIVQAEVERRAAQNEPAGRLPRWWSLLWPRSAAPVAVAALLALCGVVWWQGHRVSPRPAEMAKNESLGKAVKPLKPGAAVERLERAAVPRRESEALAEKTEPAEKSATAAGDVFAGAGNEPAQPATTMATPAGTALVTAPAGIEGRTNLGRSFAYGKPKSPPAAAPAAPMTLRYGLAARPAPGGNPPELSLGLAGGGAVDRSAAAGVTAEVAKPLAADSTAAQAGLAGALVEKDVKRLPADSARRRSAFSKAEATGAAGAAPVAPRPAQVEQIPALATRSSQVELDTGLTESHLADLNQVVEARQNFQNQAITRALRRNFNSPPRPDVLNEFRLVREGERIQVTDADGSVYTGTLRLAIQANQQAVSAAGQMTAGGFGNRGEVARQGGQGGLGGGGQAPQAAGFGAGYSQPAPVANELLVNFAGTNQSLNEKVVFDGLLMLTNTLGAQNAIALTNQPAQQWLNNSLLRGQAVVGGRTRLEINAVPAASR